MSERDDRHGQDYQELSGTEGQEKISELVKGIRICMMSTVDERGQIHSRPMATQNVPFDGTLWFLTRATSSKIGDLENKDLVTLDYADPSNNKYITLRGTAAANNDRAKIKELWNPMYKAWFPEGENDPDITVLRVDVAEGDFWDASSSKIIMGIRYVSAAITGGSVAVGQAGHVDVDAA